MLAGPEKFMKRYLSSPVPGTGFDPDTETGSDKWRELITNSWQAKYPLHYAMGRQIPNFAPL